MPVAGRVSMTLGSAFHWYVGAHAVSAKSGTNMVAGDS